jgi:hypothetical protein
MRKNRGRKKTEEKKFGIHYFNEKMLIFCHCFSFIQPSHRCTIPSLRPRNVLLSLAGVFSRLFPHQLFCRKERERKKERQIRINATLLLNPMIESRRSSSSTRKIF